MRGLLWLLAATLLFVQTSSPAFAHAVLIESSPANGARLEQPPAELHLRFSEPVSPIVVRLLDEAGTEISGISVEPSDQTLVVRPAAPLPDGAYFLSYRVTSLDGHPVGATIRFGVAADATSRTDSEGGHPVIAWSGVGARLATYLTAVLAAGLVLFLRLVDPPPPVSTPAWRLCKALARVSILAILLRFGLAGTELLGASLGDLLTPAPWLAGASTSLGASSAIAMIGLLAILAPSTLRSPWPVLGALAVAASFAFTGHAATASPRWLMRPAVALHVLCAAFWLGSFLPLVWVLQLPRAEAVRVVQRFSRVAIVAVAVLVTCGTVIAYVQLDGAITALRTTDYGWRLVTKLALVLALALVGVANRLVYTPAFASTRSDGSGLRRTLAADMALGIAVLAVTATFPLGAPPRVALPPPQAAAIRIIATTQGHEAAMMLLPSGTGHYRVEARVTGQGARPVTAREAVLLVGSSEAGVEMSRYRLSNEQPGAFQAADVALPGGGRWQLRLELLIDDFTKLIFTGEAAVPRPG